MVFPSPWNLRKFYLKIPAGREESSPAEIGRRRKLDANESPNRKSAIGKYSAQNKTGGECQRHPPPGVGGVCCRKPRMGFWCSRAWAPQQTGIQPVPRVPTCYHAARIGVNLISERSNGRADRVFHELCAPDRAENTAFAAPAGRPLGLFAPEPCPRYSPSQKSPANPDFLCGCARTPPARSASGASHPVQPGLSVCDWRENSGPPFHRPSLASRDSPARSAFQ